MISHPAARAIIQVKLSQFGANRDVLRALLRNGADPKYPLSPSVPRRRTSRNLDVSWFERVLTESGLRIPRDLAPHLPGPIGCCAPALRIRNEAGWLGPAGAVAFATPFGPLGRVVEWTILKSYLQSPLRERNAVIRKIAESDEWKRYVPE